VIEINIKGKLVPILLTLSPILFGGLALFWWLGYSNSLTLNALLVEQQTTGNANQLTEVVDNYVEDIRRDVATAGEEILSELPLPFSQLTALKFRELSTDIAHAMQPWSEVYVVSLDPTTRQFYSENRDFRSDAVFRVSLGNAVGPTAEIRGDGYEFVLAVPLSQTGWAALARVQPEQLRDRIVDSIGLDGYVEIDQGGGAVDQLLLYRLGSAPRGQIISRAPVIDTWALRYQSSHTFLDAYEQDSHGRLLNAFIFSGLAALTLVIGLILLLQEMRKRSAIESEKAIDESPKRRVYNPKATQSWSSDAGSGKQNPNPDKNSDAATESEKPSLAEVTPPESSELIEEDDQDEGNEEFVQLELHSLPEKVFRANDIRGIAETEITPQFARQLGRAFAGISKAKGQSRIFICRDGRLTSPVLSKALKRGLVESGCKVSDLGAGPTPLISQFLSVQSDQTTGIMVTASHNDKEYNGFKLILGGSAFCGSDLKDLRERMILGEFDATAGQQENLDASSDYIKTLTADITNLAGFSVVIDAANGIAGPLCIRAFEQLGCSVEALYCDVDGNFPNHGPDPCQSENLNTLCDTVVETGAHFGIALDGDGDRVVIVDNRGNIVNPDQLFQLFSQEILLRHPGSSIVFDVKASRSVAKTIAHFSGKPIMEKSGRTFIQNRVIQSGALLGGEYSSHYFFGDRWHAVDDGIYAACRLAEILRLHNTALSEILSTIPTLPATEELEIEVSDEQKADMFEKFRQNAYFPGARLIEIDGLRIEFPAAWGLIRVSNTGPKLSVRFEGESEQALSEVQAKVRQQFENIFPELNLPF